ncbi:MAG: hypothetical protein ACOYOU_17830 [Kiritimatiellia bacterium]
MIRPPFLLACIALLFLATAVRAQAPDLTTPDVQKLKSEAMGLREEISQQRVEALRKLIDDQLETTRQGLSKAKISGNITATAAGTAAVKIFADVKSSFDKNGNYAVTGKVRTDLESTVDEFKRSTQAIEDKQSADLRKLNRRFATQLGAVLARQNTPVTDEGKLLDLWTPLLTGSAAVPATAPATTPTGTNVIKAAPAASAVLQSHGDTATWTPVMKLDVSVRDALEVVSVSLVGITASKSFTGMGAMGGAWQVQVTPYQELVPGNATPAFRIQSLPPAKTLEVAAWPDARNNWTMDLRAKSDKVPSRHAVILETDAAACKPLAGGTATAPVISPAPSATAASSPASPAHSPHVATARVHFESQPDGASVLVDNQQLMEQSQPLLTPCDYTMPVTAADITFRKRGYKDAVLKQVLPMANKPFRATLEEIIGNTDVTVPVAANNNTEWAPTGARVRKGNQVRFTASGMWSCGSGGEMVDANGYPNDDTYFAYYQDPMRNPRLSPRANYGQLVARILPDNEIIPIGKQTAFRATSEGEIIVGINESLHARKDNRGTIKVRIMVDP